MTCQAFHSGENNRKKTTYFRMSFAAYRTGMYLLISSKPVSVSSDFAFLGRY